MKLAPIAMQLMANLPFVTNDFHDQVQILTIDVDSAGLVTVTTSVGHGVATGDGIVITGVESRLKIDLTKTTITGNIVTFWTIDQHNYVMDVDNEKIYEDDPSKATAYLSNFHDSFYDGAHIIKNVPATGTRDNTVKSKQSFEVEFTDPPHAITAAQPLCFDGMEYGINGFHNIIATSPTTLTFSIDPTTTEIVNLGNMVLHKKGRVTACLNSNRIEAFYTREKTENLWCFVANTSDAVSKDRNINIDATVMRNESSDYHLQVISNVGVYLAIPTSDSLTGAFQHDILEQARMDIIASLSGYVPDDPFGEKKQMINYIGCNMMVDKVAYYIQELQFEYQHDIKRENVYNRTGIRAAKEMSMTLQDDKLNANYWLQNDGNTGVN